MIAAIRALANTVARYWPWVALASCAFMLGMAHYFETFKHLAPCILCLKQREVYWIAGSIALGGCVLECTPLGPRTYRIVCALLACAFVYSLYMAGWHAGAEAGWWKGPAACASDPHAGPVGAADIANLLNGVVKPKITSCEDVVWRLGLTMAGWNVLISAKLIGWSLYSAIRGKRA